MYALLAGVIAIAVPDSGARGTRLIYKGGPGYRAFSVPECPVLRERTPACDYTYTNFTRRSETNPTICSSS